MVLQDDRQRAPPPYVFCLLVVIDRFDFLLSGVNTFTPRSWIILTEPLQDESHPFRPVAWQTGLPSSSFLCLFSPAVFARSFQPTTVRRYVFS